VEPILKALMKANEDEKHHEGKRIEETWYLAVFFRAI
jgi:hypothetical protein